MSSIWQPPERTPEGLSLIEAAEQKRRERPEAFLLDPAVIAARVSERAGRDIALNEGLVRLAQSLEKEDRLHALGRQTLAAMIGALATGLEQHRGYVAEHPEIASRQLNRPIFIIGGWRTGSGMPSGSSIVLYRSWISMRPMSLPSSPTSLAIAPTMWPGLAP